MAERSEPASADARPAPISPTRALANYLTHLRQVLNEATDSRRAWVRQIGIMMQDARTRPLAMVTPTAVKIGTEQLDAFNELRAKLNALDPPPGCGDLQALLHTWIDRHAAICRVLIDFGNTGELPRLKATQGLLAEGRADMQRFQAQYVLKVAQLKQRIEAVRHRRKSRWPFGRPGAEK